MREPGTAVKRVLVIGLDCLAPQLVFDQWRDDLPNLRGLMENGVWGELESTIPPITVPAWASMMTSKDPGRLGVYGFHNRANYSYESMSIANSRSITEDAVWDILSRAGKKVVMVGVPPSYPPKPVNGCMVGCFLTPSAKSPYTYPPELKEEIASAVGDYMVDVDDFRTEDKADLLRRIYQMTEKRFSLVKYLMREKEWDFLMMVEIGVDRMHHGFWKYFDPKHPKHEPGSPLQDAIKDYYGYLDGQIGDLLALTDGDTAVLVVSDHGAKSMQGGICINEWLMQEG
ncbi:MAG: alkaline phosphatase family protein, partial [Dehalococcoidia bacterium]|nr:alkaline phosphatase family protein [Dehalococcoidia bacterium]